MPGRALAVALLLAVANFEPAGAAQRPGQREVLERLGVYLLGYERQLASLVAEERYQQWVERRRDGDRSDALPAERRTLVSDFGFLRLPGRSEWLGLRDTFLVDGQPVRPRDARLERLLADGSPGALDELRRGIVEQNARYNLGDVARTINVPMLALDLLNPRHRWRFSFRRREDVRVDGRDLWTIAFDERERPTVVRGPRGDNRPARGIAWVDPIDGAVLWTQLRLGDGGGRNPLEATVTVRYEYSPAVDLLVPVEMRELYDVSAREAEADGIRAVATYSNFRRFQASARLVPAR